MSNSNPAKRLGLTKADFDFSDDDLALLNRISGVGDNVIIKIIANEPVSGGGIILQSSTMEQSTLGIVLKPNTFSYHNDGTQREPFLKCGDMVRMQRGNVGTTMPESPDGQEWACVSESCIYYFSRLETPLDE